MSNENEYKNYWKLWYHSVTDNSWSRGSYQPICDLKNIYDTIIISNVSKPHHLYNSMLFLMKENIYPIWEDPHNRMGGSISFKIPSDNVKKEWDKMCLFCTNNLLSTKDIITGISISPKKEFNILKIWLNDYYENISDDICYYEPYITKENMKCKKHILSN